MGKKGGHKPENVLSANRKRRLLFPTPEKETEKSTERGLGYKRFLKKYRLCVHLKSSIRFAQAKQSKAGKTMERKKVDKKIC